MVKAVFYGEDEGYTVFFNKPDAQRLLEIEKVSVDNGGPALPVVVLDMIFDRYPNLTRLVDVEEEVNPAGRIIGGDNG